MKLKPIQDDFGCKCVFSETCNTFEKPTLCNCDARGFNFTDVGVLSSDQLPIYGLQYGGSHTPFSSINYNIGPLICFGKKGFYPSEADDIEKENLELRLNELINKVKETKKDLNELSNRTQKLEKQNIDVRLNQLSNALKETQTDLDDLIFVTTSSDRSRISGNVNPNEKKISGPISIANKNFATMLDYSHNFKVSFEYEASATHQSGWHQILLGNLILFVHNINVNILSILTA